jgi:hypothetical protein
MHQNFATRRLVMLGAIGELNHVIVRGIENSMETGIVIYRRS